MWLSKMGTDWRIRRAHLGFPGPSRVVGDSRGPVTQGVVHPFDSSAPVWFQPPREERQEDAAESFPLHEPRRGRARGTQFEDVFAVEETADAQVPQPAELA